MATVDPDQMNFPIDPDQELWEEYGSEMLARLRRMRLMGTLCLFVGIVVIIIAHAFFPVEGTDAYFRYMFYMAAMFFFMAAAVGYLVRPSTAGLPAPTRPRPVVQRAPVKLIDPDRLEKPKLEIKVEPEKKKAEDRKKVDKINVAIGVAIVAFLVLYGEVRFQLIGGLELAEGPLSGLAADNGIFFFLMAMAFTLLIALRLFSQKKDRKVIDEVQARWIVFHEEDL